MNSLHTFILWTLLALGSASTLTAVMLFFTPMCACAGLLMLAAIALFSLTAMLYRQMEARRSPVKK